jgi:transcriptional regulator CtsR
LLKVEPDNRYITARAPELAKQMDVDTGDGNVNFTASQSVPTSVNGKAVDENLLTEREKQQLNSVNQVELDMLNGTKPVTPISTDTTLQPQPEANKNDQSSLNPIVNTPLSQEQGDRIIAELRENNRLSRKQTDTIESNA